MTQWNCGIGEVRTKLLETDHKQWNCGMGVFDPNKVNFVEDPAGYVIIDGKKCVITGKSGAKPGYEKIGDKEYKVVKIGNLVWMAENLDYKWDGLHIGTDQLDVNEGWDPEHSWLPEAGACYRDDDESTWGYDGRKIGLYYNETAREQLDSGIIPGWRLATYEEIQEMLNTIEWDIRAIVAKDVPWFPDYPDLSEVANSTGFTLLPSGLYDYDGNWKNWDCISTMANGGEYFYVNVVYFPEDSQSTGSIDLDSWTDDACPVRLVKDV